MDLVRSRQGAGWRGRDREAWIQTRLPGQRRAASAPGQRCRWCQARAASSKPRLQATHAGGHQAGWTPWEQLGTPSGGHTEDEEGRHFRATVRRCSKYCTGWSLNCLPALWASGDTQHTRVFTRERVRPGLSLHCSSHPHSSSAAESSPLRSPCLRHAELS